MSGSSPHSEDMAVVRLYLASGSPQRLKFMQELKLEFEVVPPCIDERKMPEENPVEYVRRLALEKSGRVVQSRHLQSNGAIVVGADTCVAVDDVVLGKPKDRQEASEMIGMLSGRVHEVHTAVAVTDNERQQCRSRTSQIEFMKLSTSQIESYLDTSEYEGRAGGYAIQGVAAELIVRLEGSYSCVVGMPMDCTIELLEDFGVSVPHYSGLQHTFKKSVSDSTWSGNFYY